MPRRFLILAAFLVAATLPVVAIGQTSMITRQYTGKPQAEINVGIFSSIRKNCTPGRLPTVRLVSPPAHGKVTVKQGKINARNLRDCLATELPALVAIYRSGANFVGEDIFTIELTDANGKSQLQRITVKITQAPNQKNI